MRLQIHFRRLRRSRVFLVTAVLVLGLGLGANLILFNTVYALLWRPLGFPQPERLVTVFARSGAGSSSNLITGQNAWTVAGQDAVVAQTGLVMGGLGLTLFRGDEALEISGAAVNSEYFKALGVRPVAGRFFGEEEDLGENPEQRAVLTESAWRMYFGADPGVVGRIFRVRGARREVRVIGIVPGAATLPFALQPDLLLPIPWAGAGVRENSGDANYHLVLRLSPGIKLSEASARIGAALRAAEAGSSGSRRFRVEPLRSSLTHVNHRTILLLYGSACLLLILTCANVASLFIARSLSRAHETSVHLALGATRWQLLRAQFQEVLLVSAAGTALAFLAESWARPLVPNFIPELKLVGPELLAAGPVLLGFGIAICLGVSLVVSLASGWRLEHSGLAEALSQGGRSESRHAGRFRAVLAAGQLAIVLTLLTVAVLVGRSFLSAMRSDPGLDPQGVITFHASIPGSQRSALPAMWDLQARIAAAPGVRGVTFAAEPPIGSAILATVMASHDGSFTSADPRIAFRLIGPSYFATLGAHLASGREFSAEEVQQGRPVALVNQAAARLLFGGEPAIGKSLHMGYGDRRNVVVGVVKNIRSDGLDRESGPMVYLPFETGWGQRFIVRTGGALGAFVPLLQARVRAWNRAVLLQQLTPLQKTVDATVRSRSIAGVLVGGFALLGLLVSSVGLYGTLAAHVQQRQREIGVRIALGATVRTVMSIVLGQGMRIVALGTAAGLAGSAAAARLIQPQLYGVRSLDPASFVLALALLASAALAACLIPALEAARVDPIRALNVQ